MWVYQDMYGTIIASRSLKKLAARMNFDLKASTKEKDSKGNVESYVNYVDSLDIANSERESWIEKLTVIK